MVDAPKKTPTAVVAERSGENDADARVQQAIQDMDKKRASNFLGIQTLIRRNAG